MSNSDMKITLNTTPEQVAQMLNPYSVSLVARESGLSAKTVYRLRGSQIKISVRTIHKLNQAFTKLRSAKRAEAA